MKVLIENLTHHPLNQRIYNLSGLDELCKSISEVGLLQPLIIDQFNQVISGNRRFESIKRLGWNKVDVVKMNIKKGDETLMLIHANQQRIKSVIEILNEHDELKKYYKLKGKLDGRKIRNIVSDDLNVSDGLLARLLYVRKHRPDYIELIEKGILSLNQSYLQVNRELKETSSRNSDGYDFKSNYNFSKENFRFVQKSSEKMDLDNESTSLIITSPPYPNNLRRYSNSKGIGNENTIEEYVENLSKHLDDCYRILDFKGSFYLNLGDVIIDGHLQSAPHKVLFRLLERKPWIHRSTIVYAKTNPKPSSTKTTTSPSYEFLFHLVKSKDYDYERVLMPLSGSTKPSHPPRHRTGKNSTYKNVTAYLPNKDGKNMPDFWNEDIIKTSISNQKLNNGIDHPAKFSKSLLTIPILSTCILPHISKVKNPKLVSPLIVDPFGGSHTVYKIIQELNEFYSTNLRYVGYDLKKYF